MNRRSPLLTVLTKTMNLLYKLHIQLHEQVQYTPLIHILDIFFKLKYKTSGFMEVKYNVIVISTKHDFLSFYKECYVFPSSVLRVTNELICSLNLHMVIYTYILNDTAVCCS